MEHNEIGLLLFNIFDEDASFNKSFYVCDGRDKK